MRILSLVLALIAPVLAAGVSEKAFPFAYQQRDFANGLRLITIPTGFPNVVSVFIVVQAGSRNEVEPGKSGFAHLFEHLMFRGTPLYSPAKYEATLAEAGAASNAYTTDDHTAYHTTFSKEDLETVLRMEADRFQHLEYSPEVFRTETLAVLGEYNKNSANPVSKLFETIRDTAYDKHTYKHTTMGFLKDIEDMPNEFAYSRTFYERYYRPEYTTIIVTGDVTAEAAGALVEKYWGAWKRGNYRAEIPVEPAQKGAREKQVVWSTPTMPWVTVSYRGPRYSDVEKDMAALDLIAFLGFGESSELYRKLVIEEQKVDALQAGIPDHMDPYLFTAFARVKKGADMEAVQTAILATMAGFRGELVPETRLDAAKRRLRYQFALRLDNSEAVAATVARYVALRRTPETIDRIYAVYDSLTPENIREAARKYLVDDGRTIVTLAGGKAQ
jgi:zinc protease